MFRIGILAIVLTCAACAHNLPDEPVPNYIHDSSLAQTFVDVNGTFYPPQWSDNSVIGRDAVKRQHSLFAATRTNPKSRDLIQRAEARWLGDLSQSAQQKRRVFIFLVGFNTNQAKSTPDLEAMRKAIAMTPEDLTIRFYWDGHNAKVYVDTAGIWFMGSGSSQVVGQRALRRVINAMGDRDIFIVSYSRGASVVLSALSDPGYSPTFRARTTQLDYLEPKGDDFFRPKPLGLSGDIRVLMLAPAIGEPDFRAPEQFNHQWVFREFPERLVSIRYTINPRDYVLNKIGIGLADNFNDTSLGAFQEAGSRVDCHYRFLQGYPVEGRRVGHGVPDYLEDPAFLKMLHDSGLRASRENGSSFPAPDLITRRDRCREWSPSAQPVPTS
jgi:hypothetical protein